MDRFTSLPELPKGLKYIRATRPSMCEHCLGILKAGEVFVACDRKIIVLTEFLPSDDGLCLKCAKKAIGLTVASQYNEAMKWIAAKDKVKDSIGSDKYKGLNKYIDGINDFIKRMGKFSKDIKEYIDEYGIEYVREPTKDVQADFSNN